MKIKTIHQLKNKWQLLILLAPTIIYFLIFHYIPMYGIELAFKDFIAAKGIIGSPWAEPLFKNFSRFFQSYNAWPIIKNTLILSIYQCIVSFILPILLALMINQVTRPRFKKLIQTVTYAPHFLSVVVMVGMMIIFLSPYQGLVNQLLSVFGAEPISFMSNPDYFRHIYVWSGAWQNTGWGAIIYLSVLTSVDPSLHEAAIVDGASRIQRILRIDLPSIVPTAVLLLILNVGSIMNIGFEKVYLMQNSLNLDVSEIISTYVYKIGLINMQYGFSTAVGLFNSVCNLVLLVSVNFISNKLTENSLF